MTSREMQKLIDEKGGKVTMNIVTSQKDYAVVTCTIESNIKHVTEIGEVTELSLPDNMKGYPSTVAWEMAFDKAARRFLEIDNTSEEGTEKSERKKYKEPVRKQVQQVQTHSVAPASASGSYDKVIPFGRFKGETIKEALKKPEFLEYVTWLKKSDVNFKNDASRQEVVDIIRGIDTDK